MTLHDPPNPAGWIHHIGSIPLPGPATACGRLFSSVPLGA